MNAEEVSVTDPTPPKRKNHSATIGIVVAALVSIAIGYFAWHQVELKDFESRRRDCIDRLIDLSDSVAALEVDFSSGQWVGRESYVGEPRAVSATGKIRTSVNKMVSACGYSDLLSSKGMRLSELTLQHGAIVNGVLYSPLAIEIPRASRDCQVLSINTAADVKSIDGPSMLWWKDRNYPVDFGFDG